MSLLTILIRKVQLKEMCIRGNQKSCFAKAFFGVERMKVSRLSSSSRTYSGEGNGNPFQYSSLEKSQGERSLAGYRPWNLKELDTTKHLSTVAAETTLGNLPLRSQFISSKYHTRDHRPIFTCSSEWSISLSKVTQVRDD